MNQSQSTPAAADTASLTDLALLKAQNPLLVQQLESPLLEFSQDPDTIRCARSILDSQGFVILRNVMKKELVVKAKDKVLEQLQKEGKLSGDGSIQDQNNKGMLLTGYKILTHTPELLAVTENRSLVRAVSLLLKGEASTFDTKWLRVKGKNEFTQIHSDYFRFMSVAQQASGPFVVAWIPLCESISPLEGGLSVLHKSHKTYDYSTELQDTEIPKDFSERKVKQIWSCNNYEAGDVVIFDIKTLHTSYRNSGAYFRISVDTRWMLKKDLKFL